MSAVSERRAAAVCEALTALGARWRGAWADFDGRTLRDQLAHVTQAINEPDEDRALAVLASFTREQNEANG